VTRSHVQTLISHGEILVNGKTLKTGHAIREEDVIEVLKKEKIVPSELPKELIPTVIAETDDYLVIAKPSGLTVHPAANRQGVTLVDWILKYNPAIAKVGEDPQRPGIVHRLDKDASGVMVIAKTHDAFEWLKRQFKLRQTKKEYLILVEGMMPRTEGEITLKLARSKRQKTKIAAIAGDEGRDAITKYWVEQQGPKAALVRVSPETGRTHQIRVHFYSFGHPVAGDPLYHQKTSNLKAKRLMLHAVKLGFHDLAGVWQEYDSAADQEFWGIVDNSLALR